MTRKEKLFKRCLRVVWSGAPLVVVALSSALSWSHRHNASQDGSCVSGTPRERRRFSTSSHVVHCSTSQWLGSLAKGCSLSPSMSDHGRQAEASIREGYHTVYIGASETPGSLSRTADRPRASVLANLQPVSSRTVLHKTYKSSLLPHC